MSTINPLTRQVSAKIVYVGPGLSGKTTSLQYIHSRLNPDARGELVSLATNEDRTLFFDFLPLRVPRVHGMEVRLQLYTVPGQVFYAAMRELVLNGADGVVFVADAQEARRESNVEALHSAERHLRASGVNLEKFPMVFQYNKMDLDTVMEIAELRSTLNPRGLPEYQSIATIGTGVIESLRAAVRGVVKSLKTNARVKRGEQLFVPASPDSGIGKQLSLLAQRGALRGAVATKVAVNAGPALSVSVAQPAEVPHNDVEADLDPGVVPSNDDASGEIAIESPPESEEVEATQDREATTERPVAGVSFGELWEVSQRAPIALIESCISGRRHHDAVHHVANALAQQLRQLPVPADTSMAARAALLGIDGHDYLRVCRLASQPNETLGSRDALFALHVLVSTRFKFSQF